jgi:hypothetical protein
MSAINARLSSPSGSTHPVVLNRRRRELLLIGLNGLIPLVLALLISVQVSHPSLILLIVLSAGTLGIAYLVVSPRYEVTLVIVALYLGLLEGPAKLGSGAHESASVVRDVLIFSVSLGAVLRMVVSRQRVKLPPLSAWVLAFAALVLVEALNPKTNGILKALGGFRQQLEWLPFFFFGYAIMRSKDRFRKLFLLLGVIAAVNGVVSTYQTRLSPGQLASWGPGYRELVFGSQETGKTGGLGARTYGGGGTAHVRPPALGTDAGAGGGIGVVALPGILALLAVGRFRRRWPLMVLSMGALVAVVTGLGRLQVVGAVFSILAFTALSLSAGRRVTKPLIAVLGTLVVALPVIAVLVSIESPGTFSRYAEIAPENVASSKDKKTTSLTHLPKQLAAAPLGVGLGTVGAASGFGGRSTELLEGHSVSAETQYNFLADELGLPGLVLWIALTMRLLVLILRRLRHVADIELRIYLAAVFATFVAATLIGLSGPTMASSAFGPYFWFSVGIAAYWFLGPGRRASAPALAGRAT